MISKKYLSKKDSTQNNDEEEGEDVVWGGWRRDG